MKRICNRVDNYKLRQMCIDHGLYTRGNDKEYSSMLERYVDEYTVSAEEVYDLAKDIKEHSETDYTVDTIAFYILKEGMYVVIA